MLVLVGSSVAAGCAAIAALDEYRGRGGPAPVDAAASDGQPSPTDGGRDSADDGGGEGGSGDGGQPTYCDYTMYLPFDLTTRSQGGVLSDNEIAATYDAGIVSGASLELAGRNFGYFDAGWEPKLGTLSVWIRPNWTQPCNTTIARMESGGVALRCSGGAFGARVTGAASADVDAGLLPLGRPSHVVARWNLPIGALSVLLPVSGARIDVDGGVPIDTTGVDRFQVGASDDGRAHIDELVVWKRILSDGEIISFALEQRQGRSLALLCPK